VVDHHLIDVSELRRIIEKEYQKAGFSAKAIDTGAIIITGETAKKENAEKILHELAGFAGDFVVAAAGPELESILAGKGSGAAELSKKTGKTIINLDIGGGTTNIAVFECGRVADAICVNVGGRLIEIDAESHEIAYISRPAQLFLDYCRINLKKGDRADQSQIETVCKAMAEYVGQIALGEETPSALSEILMTAPLKRNYRYDGVMFSGGVAEYIYLKNAAHSQDYAYGDMGPVLARAFQNCPLAGDYNLISPDQAIRATVVGAGTQTVNLSGSTIFIDKSILPVRNIPVAKVDWRQFPEREEDLSDLICGAIRRYQSSDHKGILAVSMPCPQPLSFSNISRMAGGIYDAWKKTIVPAPLVIILEKDIGKVLGQTLYTLSDGKMKFLSIDSVSLSDGDYIDIGKPISADDVVPVMIKTLIFSESGVN
ncbi:MAG TPA: ethanolamine ammonia-lyase reactivating factor EutA, partial [Clostridia bacterium]|nr:ethanolamine ammonia-lyase reactivating factor EutA [Clostridia bacterium]